MAAKNEFLQLLVGFDETLMCAGYKWRKLFDDQGQGVPAARLSHSANRNMAGHLRTASCSSQRGVVRLFSENGEFQGDDKKLSTVENDHFQPEEIFITITFLPSVPFRNHIFDQF